jgi:DNA invertase Pin-like site-specific DNA recombinase
MVAPVLNGRLVGYARVSRDDQDLSLQIDSLTSLGISQDDIFTEKISGAKTGTGNNDDDGVCGSW